MRNDLTTRNASFNTGKVVWKNHVLWFNKFRIDSKKNIFIIIDKRGKKIGQIRFDRKSGCSEINIAIDSKKRHKGYGTKAIKEGCKMYIDNFDVQKIIAKIKSENIASIKAFEKAGFEKHKKHQDYIELILNKK